MTNRIAVRPDDALIVVDIQNDFCTGGALAVPQGEDVIPVINHLMPRFDVVVLTQDWHPRGHHSFASSHPGKSPYDTVVTNYGEQVLWPDHCVQGTNGAAFHPALAVAPGQLVIRKGFRKSIDSYSAFFENDQQTPTGLTGYLRERGVQRVFLAGLALDFCVRWSAEDATKQGFPAYVIMDGSRGIDTDGSVDATLRLFEDIGVRKIDMDAFA